MKLPKFMYSKPNTIKEAAHLLNKNKLNAVLKAGGTELLPRMKYRLNEPKLIISLKEVPVESPYEDDNGDIVINGLISLNEFRHSTLIKNKFPSLIKAADSIATNEIRNMGTLGGNICQNSRCLYYNQSHRFQFTEPCFKRGGHICYFAPNGNKCFAVYMGDIAPAFISLKAKILLESTQNIREILIEDLYNKNPQKPINIKNNEILTKIIIPQETQDYNTNFIKFSFREGLEFGAVNTSVAFKRGREMNTCSNARIVVGAATTFPVRIKKAESILTEDKLSFQNFSKVAKIVANEAPILPHHGYSKSYIKKALYSTVISSLNI